MKAVLLIDFGSTYTKVTAVDVESEEILGTAQSFTTIETDIMHGLNNAVAILKEKIESKCRKVTQWVFKELVFHASLILLLLLSRLFLTEDVFGGVIELVVIFVALSEVAFVLFDIAMTRMISFYVY